MSVVGPNGKDVFSVAYTTKERGNVYIGTILVEALSKDEAYGLVRRWAKVKGIKSIGDIVVGSGVVMSHIVDAAEKKAESHIE